MDYQQPYVQSPNSHMGLALVTTLCCCSPLGLIAIYKASKVRDYYIMGQYNSALIASNSAKRWCVISFCISFFINLFFLTIVTFSIGMSFFSIIPWLEVLFEFISKLNELMSSFMGFWNI